MPPGRISKEDASLATTRPKTFSECLQAVTKAAADRTEEANQLFGSCTLASTKDLPRTLPKTSCLWRNATSTVTCGAQLSPLPYSVSPNLSPTVEQEIEKSTLPGPASPASPETHPRPTASFAATTTPDHSAREPTSYSGILKAGPSLRQAEEASQPTRKPSRVSAKRSIDRRIMVRLPPNHLARSVSGFSLVPELNKVLGGKVLRDVQPTRTGFALSLASRDMPSMHKELFPKIVTMFGDCVVEEASNLTSLLSNVPRSYTALTNPGPSPIVTSVPVTDVTLEQALQDVASAPPVTISETQASQKSLFSPSTSWVVRFPHTVTSLPRTLNILGVAVSTRLLTQKVSTIQCARCWGWHNIRSCARNPRCRLCGSSQHTEESHTPCCSTAHDCPPRCLHCHGPHPADFTDCLLRPKAGKVTLTKQQRASIRKAEASSLLQLQASKCVASRAQASPSQPPAISSSSPSTPKASGALTVDTEMSIAANSPSLPSSPSATPLPQEHFLTPPSKKPAPPSRSQHSRWSHSVADVEGVSRNLFSTLSSSSRNES